MTAPPPLPSLPPAPLRLGVDAAALAHNWRTLAALATGAATGAAVKADCYGLGTAQCVPPLRAAGCRDWFVAHWSEVPALLRHVPADEVAVLHGPLSAQDAAFARATGVRPVIVSFHQARLWVEGGGGPCDLMVDTGINRLGIAASEIADPAVRALAVDTLHSHLASADEDSAQNAAQLAAFRAILPLVPHRRAAMANSAGVALGSDYHFGLTRPGLALYGGVPRGELAGSLRQVAHPAAAILQTRVLQPGDRVGYNGTFAAPRAMRTGVVSLGYADGILRAWAGAALRNGGRDLPILGKVSMDMIVIDLTGAVDLAEGDWVELPYDLPAAAAHTGLSQYELLTILGRRFAR